MEKNEVREACASKRDVLGPATLGYTYHWK